MVKVEFKTRSGQKIKFNARKRKSGSLSKVRSPKARRMAQLVKKHHGDFHAASKEYHAGSRSKKSRSVSKKSRSKKSKSRTTYKSCTKKSGCRLIKVKSLRKRFASRK